MIPEAHQLSSEKDLGEWHFVWKWWPVPQFMFTLLGEDGCQAFIRSLPRLPIASGIIVSFSLAVEHGHKPICTRQDLTKAVARISAPDYDFGPAEELERNVCTAQWSKRATAISRQATSYVDEQSQLTNAILTKGLPAGPEANLVLIRAILASHSKN